MRPSKYIEGCSPGDISPFWNLLILDTLYENICSRDHLHRSDEDVCLERKSFPEQ